MPRPRPKPQRLAPFRADYVRTRSVLDYTLITVPRETYAVRKGIYDAIDVSDRGRHPD